MKKIFIQLFCLLPLLTYGQYEEIIDELKREIIGNHVKIIKVYCYNHSGQTTDTTLQTLQKYNQKGQLIERCYFSGKDTSDYDKYEYIYDTINNSLTEKHIYVTSVSIDSLVDQNVYRVADPAGEDFRYPRKTVKEANEKGQLIKEKVYNRGRDVYQIDYKYQENNLLEEVRASEGKKIWIYKFIYEYY